MAEHKESSSKNKNAEPINAVEKKSSFQLKDNRAAAVVQQKQIDGLQQLPIQKKTNTVQLADDGEPGRSFRNLVHYSFNTVTEYGEARIMRALTANHLVIRGHHSGSGGDGMNAATRQDIAALVRVLRAENPAPAEEAEEVKGKERRKGGQRHSKEEEAERAAEKAKQKQAKKAAKRDFFNANQRGGRGGGRGGRGGGHGGIRV